MPKSEPEQVEIEGKISEHKKDRNSLKSSSEKSGKSFKSLIFFIIELILLYRIQI